MALGNLEILATILIVIGLIKFAFILFSPKSWWKFAKNVYSNYKISSVVMLVLAAFVLYVLLGEGMTIVEILAVMLFMALLIGAGMARYADKLLKMIKPEGVLRENWLYALVFFLLIIWGLVYIFF